MRSVLATLVAGALLAACSVERIAVDEPCRYNSECADRLVCADGRCRAQCHEDRDCAFGWLCAASGTPDTPVCLPPASPLLCAFSDDCPPGSRCVDGRCRVECGSDADCPELSPCRDGVCDGLLHHDRDAGTGLVTRDEGGLACGMGRAACGDACVDLSSAPDHCGACDVRCPDAERCTAGVCVCLAPQTVCGSRCADLERDPEHCGACFERCDGLCRGGVCCGVGRAFCGGSCVDVDTDERSCGDCGRECGPRSACLAGRCRSDLDRCADAYHVALEPGVSFLDLVGTVAYDGATDSPHSCSLASDVFYALEVTERSVVAVIGTSNEGGPAIGWVEGDCLEAPSDCSDRRSCGGRVAARVLEPGVHRVVIDGISQSTIVRVLHAPVGAGSATELPPGAFEVRGTTVGSSSPSTTFPGAEQAFFWVGCAAGAFRASTCGPETTFDSALELVSASATGVSRVTDTDACAPGAMLEATLAGEAALHVLFVDGQAAGAAGDFVVRGERP